MATDKTLTSTATEFPTLREIFYNSDLTEHTTAEYDKLDKDFKAALKAVCKTFKEYDDIDTAATATGKVIEAQLVGFEQGVAFALGLLGESRSYAAQIKGGEPCE